MLRVGIWVESFRCAGILLLPWQGENFGHRQHLKYLPLSTCTLCQQKSYISKSIQPIFEIFASARRCFRVVIWVESFRCAVFYFCNGQARWKFCASTTFEILPLSTCTLCQQKSYISNGIQPIFEIFASARRCLGWCICGGKFQVRRLFYFCNGKVKSLRIDKIWNFADFNLYTVPAKILYLQKYSTDFRNLCLRSKMLRVGIWVESFMCAGILLLQWEGENFAPIDNIWNFADFQLVHCGNSKILHASKGIQPLFEIFAIEIGRCLGWSFGWKVSSAQVFYFCNGKVKTLGIENIWNFATFNLYPVAEKILRLQRYSTAFRNLRLELEDV